MFSNLNCALSWAITSFGNKFCLEKRSELITALDNNFHVKFMQLEIGLLQPKPVKNELTDYVMFQRQPEKELPVRSDNLYKVPVYPDGHCLF